MRSIHFGHAAVRHKLAEDARRQWGGRGRRPPTESNPMPLALIALTIASFGIGTTEFVIMGLLPDVARDLAVSIPSAGFLVTGYARGGAVGAPLLAVLTAKMPRKLALQLLMGVFIVGNVLCAVAPGYSWLMVARV